MKIPDGWIPDGKGGYSKPPKNQPVKSPGVERESDLHAAILRECKRRCWIAFHGSMAHSTFRTEGEPDFVILANSGRVFLIECKTRNGKLSPAQNGIKHWAFNLGHEVHIIRSMEQFIELTK